jgi:general secretion pathway protein A
MVLDYYKLREQPFGATPDPRFLFESETHREALASLLYGIEAGRGFFALIARPGMGKTTLLFSALSLLKGKAKTVFLFQTICTPLDFLRALLADLGIRQAEGSIIELQAKLNDILEEFSRRGERLLVVIDEAQKLDDAVLELIRMLSNFETSQEKLIHIILCGQPELAHKLASPNLVQLRQRVSIVARLQPFDFKQTADYIEHRLGVAGWNSENRIFAPEAVRLIAKHSAGIPRNINNLCFNSLSLGCSLKRKTIGLEIVREVIADLDLNLLTDDGDDGFVAVEAKSHLTIWEMQVPERKNSAWLTRAAVASVVMFVLSGMSANGREGRRSLANISQSSGGVPRLLAASANPTLPMLGTPLHSTAPLIETGFQNEPKTNSSGGKMVPLESVIQVLVPPGATLSQICAKTLTTCRSMDIRTIEHLNPWLTNPDRLESGRLLRIPIRANVLSAGAQPLDLHYSSKPSMEEASK